MSTSDSDLLFWKRALHVPIVQQENTQAVYVELPERRGNLPLPPTSLLQYAHAGETCQSHATSGERDFEEIWRVVQAHRPNFFSETRRVLDFGCGIGRVTRHWAAQPNRQVTGCDINAERIYWCVAHLSPPFKFFVSTFVPHLPLRDNSQDLVYAFSVFTHIDDLHISWLYELRRVVSDAGLLLITISDESTVEIFKQQPNRYAAKVLFSEPNWPAWSKRWSYMALRRGQSGQSSEVFMTKDYLEHIVAGQFNVVAWYERSMAGVQSLAVLEPVS
jgi:ubiquinone/menaquinone biosynthesis C-methylase UbiE